MQKPPFCFCQREGSSSKVYFTDCSLSKTPSNLKSSTSWNLLLKFSKSDWTGKHFQIYSTTAFPHAMPTTDLQSLTFPSSQLSQDIQVPRLTPKLTKSGSFLTQHSLLDLQQVGAGGADDQGPSIPRVRKKTF